MIINAVTVYRNNSFLTLQYGQLSHFFFLFLFSFAVDSVVYNE